MSRDIQNSHRPFFKTQLLQAFGKSIAARGFSGWLVHAYRQRIRTHMVETLVSPGGYCLLDLRESLLIDQSEN